MTETTGLIEQYAAHLEGRASRVVRGFSMLGALVGAALGGFPLFQHSNALVPHHLGYATLLLGGAAGAYLGWSLGERRAVDLRFQAQLALRQLHVEQALMRGAVARPAAPVLPVAAPAPAPVVPVPAPAPAAPAPAPAAAPAPVAAPAPALAPPAAPAPAPMPAAVRLPTPAPIPAQAPPVVQVAPTPPPVVPSVDAPAQEEPAPPDAVSPAPPRLVQPPLSSTGA